MNHFILCSQKYIIEYIVRSFVSKVNFKISNKTLKVWSINVIKHFISCSDVHK